MRYMILLSIVLMGWSNSSAQINDLGIAIFDYRNYEGQHIFISDNWTADETQLSFGIESVRIPKGWEVWLYEGPNYTGLYRSLKGSWNGNGKRDWQWRNDIKSIRIISQLKPTPYLQSITSSLGIAIFKNKDYRGEHKFIKEDFRQAQGCFDFGIESIRIPHGWEIWIYEGDNFTGRHKKLTEDWDGESYDDWKWRNDIRSIRIVKSNIAWIPYRPKRAVVNLYDDSNFKGESFELSGEWTVLNNNELWNDRISSIEIPVGFEVHVFEHAHFKGKMKILKRDWMLENEEVFWNNRISSIRVYNEGYVQK